MTDGNLAGRRIAVVLQGDATDPRAWSGIPFGISAGLREAGAEPVAVDARVPLASHLADLLRISWTRRTTSAFFAGPEGRSASRALARAGAEAAVAIGSGYELAATVPYATYDDMTVVQALRQPGSEYERVSPRAGRRWVERQRRGYEASAACCVASEWAAASVVEDYGIDPGRVHVVGFGRNLPLREVERDWSVPRFVFVGRDWERKRGAAVVAAFAAVRRSHPAATLDLVGGHPPVTAPGVSGHGPLPLGSAPAQRRLTELLRRATCLVLPSSFEPFGIAYVDAGAHGVPSIATANGGAATAVGAGGVLVDPSDEAALVAAMLELADPATARRLGERAREQARRFSWRAVATRVVAALDARQPA